MVWTGHTTNVWSIFGNEGSDIERNWGCYLRWRNVHRLLLGLMMLGMEGMHYMDA